MSLMRVYLIKNEEDLYASSEIDLTFVDRPLCRRWETKDQAEDAMGLFESEYDGTMKVVSLKVRDK